MNGKFLLDTNILIAVLGGEQTVLKKLTEDSEFFVPSITVGELYYGAHCSQQVATNLQRLDDLLGNVAVLSCDENTAKAYGRIKSDLRRWGRQIPENDLWIAAIAMQAWLAIGIARRTLLTRPRTTGRKVVILSFSRPRNHNGTAVTGFLLWYSC